MSKLYHEIDEKLSERGINSEDLVFKKPRKIGEIVYDILDGNSSYTNKNGEIVRGYINKPSVLKNNSTTRFKLSGCKYAEKLIKINREYEGDLYSTIIEIGDRPFYEPETIKLAYRLSDTVFGKLPRFESYERSNNRKNKVHLHGLVFLPKNFKLIKRVEMEIDGEYRRFPVKIELLGLRHPKQSIEINVKKFIGYLMKAPDGKANRERHDLTLESFGEWFIFEHRKVWGKSERVRMSRAVSLRSRKVISTLTLTSKTDVQTLNRCQGWY